MIRLWIPGKPVAKARPRFARGGIHTDKRTAQAERAIASAVRLVRREIITGPVDLTVVFCFGVPRSWPKRRKAEMLASYHTQHPDTDNLIKTVLDALNGVAWQDDRQVARIEASKLWTIEDGIRLSIRAAQVVDQAEAAA